MRISVIIPALNEETSIASSVRSAWQAGADEVLVVDGGSVDETIAKAEAEGCRLITSVAGRAIQQNAGAKQATGEVLLFLHADCLLSPTAIEQIRKLFRDDQAARSGAFRQQIAAAGGGYRLVEWGNAWRVRWRGLPYGDQAIFMRREFFDTVGGFPKVSLMEDLLLMRKARRVSWPCLLDGPVTVDARRWQRHGVVRQTLRNCMLLLAHGLGWSPDTLARYYRRHDTA